MILPFFLAVLAQASASGPLSCGTAIGVPRSARLTLPVAPPIQSLEAAVHAGSLAVRPSGSGETYVIVRVARMSVDGRSFPVNDPLDHIVVEKDSGTLRVRDRHANDADRDRWRVDVDVRLGTALRIDARSRLGNVLVTTGKDAVYATSGEAAVHVDLGRDVLDRLEAHAGEGRVSVQLGGVRSRARLSVGSGTLAATFTHVAPDELLADGGEAKIRVGLPKDVRCVLEGSIGAGSWEVHSAGSRPARIRETAGGGFRFVAGDGGGPRYRFECGEGDITVLLTE